MMKCYNLGRQSFLPAIFRRPLGMLSVCTRGTLILRVTCVTEVILLQQTYFLEEQQWATGLQMTECLITSLISDRWKYMHVKLLMKDELALAENG
ncbi:hypothetical protein CEXT_82581 [Caerostris extrusa]|uniref:Uncharacterized protein n=1 Tax=Caerostris extrusa TaxID=172846 RepID=A0AAV4M4A2_CAEEX|nr:hypothetical protein CEXT_82581 [Caerostris extrusa]